MNTRLLIQFAKAPVPGQVKTRLQPPLSADQAACLHAALVTHCFVKLQPQPGQDWDYRLQVSEPEHGYWREPLFAGTTCTGQGQGDLGQRMARAFQQAFAAGYQKVLLVGSDCPDLGPEYLHSALAGLDRYPLVYGPALDGGYVLVGMTAFAPVFAPVDWGSAAVLAQSLALAQQLGLPVGLLAPLADLDRPEDLPLLTRYPDLRGYFYAHHPSAMRN